MPDMENNVHRLALYKRQSNEHHLRSGQELS